MKRIFLIALLLVCAGMLSGCSAHAKLYPVKGPLASQTAPPVYSAKITLTPNWSKPVTVGAHANDSQGNISAVLANGETFQGTWKIVYGEAGDANSANSPFAGAWDTVYGSGYYTAHVLGTPLFAHVMLTGSKGTTLTVEWYEEVHGTGANRVVVGKGIAQDSKGNVFKLVF